MAEQATKFLKGRGDKTHPFTIRLNNLSSNELDAYYEWCQQSFNGRCDKSASWIWFKTEADRDWFLVRWS